jgi:superoxide dismutase, Cu-Zn family
MSASMRLHPRFTAGLMVGALCGIAAGGVTIATGDDDDDDARYEARAEILGPPGSGIRGEARFEQRSLDDQPTPVVEVDVWVRGLPQSPSARAFHVHETGACEPSFTAAGGHFDAGPAKNTTPPDYNHPYHLGDLPELELRGRTFRMNGATTRFVLQPDHATTIFDADGAAVIVHELEDRGEETPPGQPGFAGSAGGGRVACGVIEMEQAGDDDD